MLAISGGIIRARKKNQTEGLSGGWSEGGDSVKVEHKVVWLSEDEFATDAPDETLSQTLVAKLNSLGVRVEPFHSP